MAFNSFFNALPFNGTFDNGMPTFPFGGAYPGFSEGQPAAQKPSPASAAGVPTNSAAPFSQSNVSGFSADPYNPQIGGGIGGSGYGDAQFATMGFNPPMGASSSYSGYNPQTFGIAPAQLSGLGSIGLGNISQNFLDRLSSLGNDPKFNSGNLLQTGINAAGMAVPGVSALAGLLQGFNVFEPGYDTGNPITNIAGTPGVTQSLVADGANWINRLFGGSYMNSDKSAGQAIANSPGIQNLTNNAQDLWLGADPNAWASMVPSPVSSGSASTPSPSDWQQLGDSIVLSQPLPDPYSMSGNMLDSFMLGAGFGGGRFGGSSTIGGGGWGGGFGWGPTLNNGGWGE